MPELPEVETVRRHLERQVRGRTVESVWSSGLALRKPLPPSLVQGARGRTIDDVRRHGKFLILDLDDGSRIVAHLGMTGKFLFHATAPAAKEPLPPHTHVLFRFTDGAALAYQDARRFGLLDWIARGEDDAKRLGPPGRGVDPLRERLDGKRLAVLFARCRGPVKPLLLDQKRIAGIGNIYACEALFRARVGPRRRMHTLTKAERERLAGEIHAVLDRAVEHRGTTFSDFRDLDDRAGEYGSSLLVYDREGEPCPNCTKPIRRIVQSGRSTYYCTDCQGRASAKPPTKGAPARGSRRNRR